MSDKRSELLRKLARLEDAILQDLDHTSSDELFGEVEEEYGSIDEYARQAQNIIASAIKEHGQRRLAAAREGFANFNADLPSKVFSLSIEEKRALIRRFAKTDAQLEERLTLATRNEKDAESDIDSCLEDLLELGVIDEHGNLI